MLRSRLFVHVNNQMLEAWRFAIIRPTVFEAWLISSVGLYDENSDVSPFLLHTESLLLLGSLAGLATTDNVLLYYYRCWWGTQPPQAHLNFICADHSVVFCLTSCTRYLSASNGRHWIMRRWYNGHRQMVELWGEITIAPRYQSGLATA